MINISWRDRYDNRTREERAREGRTERRPGVKKRLRYYIVERQVRRRKPRQQ